MNNYQISVAHKDVLALDLNDKNFSNGSLRKDSFIRPDKFFTADKTTFLKTIGKIYIDKFKQVSDAIFSLIRDQ